MTLVSSLIRDAYRESNIVALKQNPTTEESAEALGRLQVIVNSVYGFEVGEPLSDWPVGLEGVQFPTEIVWNEEMWRRPVINVRLIAASATAQTVYMPANPFNGSRVALIDPANRLAAAPLTINGNGRTIEGSQNFVANTNGLTKMWLYRADTGNWTPLTPMALVDQFPFPDEFDDYFVTHLAMRLNPRYGRSMAAESLEALNRGLVRLQAMFRQPGITPTDPALIFLAEQYNGSRNMRGMSAQMIGDRGFWGVGRGWML